MLAALHVLVAGGLLALELRLTCLDGRQALLRLVVVAAALLLALTVGGPSGASLLNTALGKPFQRTLGRLVAFSCIAGTWL